MKDISKLQRTADPDVFIETSSPGYVLYYRKSDGRRWEVRGTCDRRGDCLIGAVIQGEQVRDFAHLEEFKRRFGKKRIDSEMDVPVTPEFGTCCGSDRFQYTELETEL